MTQLTRGHGRYWCPMCCRTRGEGEMTVFDPATGERHVLTACRRCQLSSSKANHRARTASFAGRW